MMLLSLAAPAAAAAARRYVIYSVAIGSRATSTSLLFVAGRLVGMVQGASGRHTTHAAVNTRHMTMTEPAGIGCSTIGNSAIEVAAKRFARMRLILLECFDLKLTMIFWGFISHHLSPLAL